MKTKIEIVNGDTTITLLPENKFEERLIEDWHDEDKDSDISIFKKSDSYYSSNKRNAVEIVLTEKKKVEPEPIIFTSSYVPLEPQPPTWAQLKFSELNKCDIIRHKGNTDIYMVDGVYGDRATAHSSVDITNEIEWEVLKSAR